MVEKVGALLSLAKEDNGVVRVALGGRLSQLHSTLTGLSAAASRSPTTSPPGPLLPGRPLPILCLPPQRPPHLLASATRPALYERATTVDGTLTPHRFFKFGGLP